MSRPAAGNSFSTTSAAVEMNFFKLIQAIEQLIFEVAGLLVFIPLTFARVFLLPHRIHGYVSAELERDGEDRFVDRTVPPLYWAIVGVLSAFVLLAVLRIAEFFPEIDAVVPTGLSHEATISHLAVVLVSGPVAFATAAVVCARKRLTHATLRPAFYIQCYVFATAQFVAVVAGIFGAVDIFNAITDAILAGTGGGGSRSLLARHFGTLARVLSLAAIIWFMVAEAFVLWGAVASSYARRRSALKVGLSTVLSFAIWAAIVGGWIFLSMNYVEAMRQLEPAATIESRSPDGAGLIRIENWRQRRQYGRIDLERCRRLQFPRDLAAGVGNVPSPHAHAHS